MRTMMSTVDESTPKSAFLSLARVLSRQLGVVGAILWLAVSFASVFMLSQTASADVRCEFVSPGGDPPIIVVIEGGENGGDCGTAPETGYILNDWEVVGEDPSDPGNSAGGAGPGGEEPGIDAGGGCSEMPGSSFSCPGGSPGSMSSCGDEDVPSHLTGLCDPEETDENANLDGLVECAAARRVKMSPASCAEYEALDQSKIPACPTLEDLVEANVSEEIIEKILEDLECDCQGETVDATNCEAVAALEAGLNILTGAAGLAIIGGIMFGGYLYMTARDNPGQIAAARSKIVWALVALLILLFFWGFLQWLIPGGLL